MPERDDAIQVVTDPANLTRSDDSRSGFRAVNQQRAVRALRDQGAGRAEARDLAIEAVRHIGGKVESRVQGGGQAGGRDDHRIAETWLVPIGEVRR